MQTTTPKVRLNRVKEKNKKQQRSKDTIEEEFTKFAKTRKYDGDRTPNSKTNATNGSEKD